MNPTDHSGGERWQMSYRAFTADGKLCVAGLIVAERMPLEGETIEGKRVLKAFGVYGDVRNRAYVGPQAGEHYVKISKTTKEYVIEFNPNMEDNNVTVTFSPSRSQPNGRWEYYSDAGLTSHGTCALKRSPGGGK